MSVLKRLHTQLSQLSEIFACYAISDCIAAHELRDLMKVFESEGVNVEPILREIIEEKVTFVRFLLYLPFFMRLHLQVIKSLRL